MTKQEKFEQVCNIIASSDKGLHHICKEVGMSHETFYKMIRGDENVDNMDKYTRAREMQADYLADQIIAIADDSSQDVIETENGEVENREFVSRSRLRVEARKWIAAKLKPKKYGDKLDVDAQITKTVISFKDAE